jgi:hypothetical protein
MSNRWMMTVVAGALVAPSLMAAQNQPPAARSKSPEPITLTGCMSAKPGASGEYTFEGVDGISRYQLKGKSLKKFAGMRVEVVGGASNSNAVAVRGGLVGPLNGARGVAIDPAQESVKRQPGGGGAGVGPAYPEFKVSRVKAVGGACEAAPAR